MIGAGVDPGGGMAGRVALVTGGAQGLGLAAVQAFAARGAAVCVADVRDQQGADVVAGLRDRGATAHYVHADVTDEDAVEAMVATAVAELGGLDYAYNNAGISHRFAPTAELERDEWQRTLDVNLTGVWLCMRAELRHMAAHGGGVIVNCASAAGLMSYPHLPAYVASKWGVVGISRTAAREYGPQGIRVVAVCPGGIETPLLAASRESSPAWAAAAARRSTPLGRTGEPHEIGEAVAWLCSEGASFVTGQALAVDGGLLA